MPVKRGSGPSVDGGAIFVGRRSAGDRLKQLLAEMVSDLLELNERLRCEVLVDARIGGAPARGRDGRLARFEKDDSQLPEIPLDEPGRVSRQR